MTQSLEQLRNQMDSQLDLTFRIVQISGGYAEKIVATHFAMLQDLLKNASLPENFSTERSWESLSEHGSVLVGYYKTCMREGLAYQKQVLSELSHK